MPDHPTIDEERAILDELERMMCEDETTRAQVDANTPEVHNKRLLLAATVAAC